MIQFNSISFLNPNISIHSVLHSIPIPIPIPKSTSIS